MFKNNCQSTPSVGIESFVFGASSFWQEPKRKLKRKRRRYKSQWREIKNEIRFELIAQFRLFIGLLWCKLLWMNRQKSIAMALSRKTIVQSHFSTFVVLAKSFHFQQTNLSVSQGQFRSVIIVNDLAFTRAVCNFCTFQTFKCDHSSRNYLAGVLQVVLFLTFYSVHEIWRYWLVLSCGAVGVLIFFQTKISLIGWKIKT